MTFTLQTMSFLHPDLVLTIDGREHAISREVFSSRSMLLRELFETCSNDDELSKAVQNGWSTVRKQCGDPVGLEFEKLCVAMRTGLADPSLYHLSPNKTDIVLGYYQTVGVTYGQLVIQVPFPNQRYLLDTTPFYVYSFVFPRELMQEADLYWIRTRRRLTPDPQGRDWRRISSQERDYFFTHVTNNEHRILCSYGLHYKPNLLKFSQPHNEAEVIFFDIVDHDLYVEVNEPTLPSGQDDETFFAFTVVAGVVYVLFIMYVIFSIRL